MADDHGIRSDAVNALETLFVYRTSLETFLEESADVELNDIVNLQVGVHHDHVKGVVDWFADRGQLHKLVTKAIAAEGDLDERHPLYKVQSKLRDSAGSPDGNPHEACLLAGSDHFVDRGILRGVVEQLAGPDTKKVLRVWGNPNSGRSFSLNYINHIYSDSTVVKRLSFKLDDFLGDEDPVKRLLTKICLRMGWDLGGMPDRADDMGDWFMGKKNGDADTKLWLILDNCDAPGLEDNGINSFIDFLADEIEGFVNLRLVLLAKQEPVSNEEREIIEVPDEIAAKPVVERHLERYLELKNIGFDESALSVHVDTVVELTNSDEPFFPAVKDALAAWEQIALTEED